MDSPCQEFKGGACELIVGLRRLPYVVVRRSFAAAVLVVGVACTAPVTGEPVNTSAATTAVSVPSSTTASVAPTTAATNSTESGATTTLAISVPEEGPVFGEETGMLLLLDDGIEGLTAVDLDRRLAARSVVEGQRAGDEPYSMIKVGDRLVVGWAEPYSVDLVTREGISLGGATIFVPAAEPNRVWMIDYPGGRIGQGDPLVWQVDVVSGERVSEPTSLPRELYPAMGIPGGLALQTEGGISLWGGETGSFTHLAANGFGSPHDVHSDDLVWCRDRCTQLVVTDTSNMESETFDPPSGYDMFLTSKVSPDGRTLAALVGRQGREFYEGEAIWLLDRDTNETIVVSDPQTHVEELAWAPDGDQLFATSYSYLQTRTAVWRYKISDQEFSAVVLPFGGAISLVVVESSVADAYVGDELVDPAECSRAGDCTFEL